MSPYPQKQVRIHVHVSPDDLLVSLDRIGATDIGRKFDGGTGSVTLATGWMIATFHCFGTIDDDTERLIRWVCMMELVQDIE